MFCEKCGTKLPDGAKFCGSCGSKSEAQPASAAIQEQPTASVPESSYTPPAAPQPPVQQDYYAPQPVQSTQPQIGNEPLSVGQYIGMFLLMCIPLVNIILMFVWGFGSDVNLNKKNYAKATLILAVIMLVLWILFGVLLGGVISAIFSGMGGSTYY